MGALLWYPGELERLAIVPTTNTAPPSQAAAWEGGFRFTPMTPLTIRAQNCPNCPAERGGCPAAGGARTVVIHSQRERRLRCTACGCTWVERFGQPSFGLRLDAELLVRARTLLGAGASVRITARRLRVSPATVQRWKARIVRVPAPGSSAP